MTILAKLTSGIFQGSNWPYLRLIFTKLPPDMRSRASFKGHPIHPMLIPFPIAFLTGAFLFDLLGVLAEVPRWWGIGHTLIGLGILAGLVAAIPGFIDYLTTVPPESSAKKRTTKHALFNVTALLLFGASFLLRGGADVAPGAFLLALELAGIACLAVGGWMGGTLVYRNEIGVDRRYASAGKWREERIEDGVEREIVVATSDELAVDQMKLIHLDGRRIAVGRTEGGYVAFEDRCPHRGGSLAAGAMICGTVQCPWHGSQFDARTGEVKAGPAEKGITTFRVEARGDEVVLHI
jgi:uncharacterized membrane protein/nitrite reductase/ring-hydroxylating ferredoxin subunit